MFLKVITTTSSSSALSDHAPSSSEDPPQRPWRWTGWCDGAATPIIHCDSASTKTLVADEGQMVIDQAKDAVEESCWSSKLQNPACGRRREDEGGSRRRVREQRTQERAAVEASADDCYRGHDWNRALPCYWGRHRQCWPARSSARVWNNWFAHVRFIHSSADQRASSSVLTLILIRNLVLYCFAPYVWDIRTWGVVSSLGEICTLIPTPGAFSQLSARFVDPALGFTLGWNYWLSWAFTLPAELSAISIIVKFWLPDVPSYVWAIVSIIPLTALNLLGARGYGEAEYWLSLIKVIVIILFIIVGTFAPSHFRSESLIVSLTPLSQHQVGIAIDLGANKDLGFIGGSNWNVPGAPIGEADVDGPVSTRQFVAILGAFTTAFYAYGGTELAGLASGEAANPRKTVPRAIRGAFLRILIFYLLTVLVVGLIIPATDPTLGTSDISASPFTRVFQYSGIKGAEHLMNAVIILDLIDPPTRPLRRQILHLRMLPHAHGSRARGQSATNIRSREQPGRSRVLPRHLPGARMRRFVTLWGDGVVFNYLVHILGMSNLLTWLTINETHIRIRIGWVKQGNRVQDLPYIAPLLSFPDILLGHWALSNRRNHLLRGDVGVRPRVHVPVVLGAPVVLWSLYWIWGVEWNELVPYEDMDFDTFRINWRPGMDDGDSTEKKGMVKRIISALA
ncbi:hypothetical protein M427DRAFT_41125 [Gonapodya prolifera JEL478]|uniref:Amino acid permease/ SLC12A domain-containing protein n=1 Tax=Gonapodya prolifera (strain JEL478) TaxID=1344416 RepID=A0A139AW77_GONPJ|nr:hypothetical protein M427DRAFT_41125 [Gonapodya prolifera JEL478]|eukprot:KXS20959.1 hypothetical protein M427DRAFT_41125 [Gonapodya prolifera JEL478]